MSKKTYAIIYKDFEELENYQKFLAKSLDSVFSNYHTRRMWTDDEQWIPVKVGTTDATGWSFDGFTALPDAIVVIDDKDWFEKEIRHRLVQHNVKRGQDT